MRAIALTMGDSAGIGPEIALKAWARRREAGVPPFVYLGDADHVDALAAALGLEVPVESVAGPAEAAEIFADSFPVLPIALPAPVVRGTPDPSNGPATIEAIDRAVDSPAPAKPPRSSPTRSARPSFTGAVSGIRDTPNISRICAGARRRPR